MPPRPSTAKAVLSYVWVIGLLLFFVLLASNFATLYVVTPQIVEGIQQVRTGATTNPGLDLGNASWTFVSTSGGASGVFSSGFWSGSGGNPGGFLGIRLPAASDVGGGFWMQAFTATGSSPYAATVRFDYQMVQSTGVVVSLRMFVDRDPGNPVRELFATTVGSVGGWTPATTSDPLTGEFETRVDVSSAVRDPGAYYVKVWVTVVYPPGATGETIFGLDNFQLRWGTNAALVLFLIVPVPVVLARSRDPAPFTAYYALLAVALVASLVYQLAADARPLWRMMASRPEDLGGRLRARVGVVALAQTFLAIYFFQYVFIRILNFLGVPTPSPLSPVEFPRWFLVYELANASVWEEVITRVMMIGIPMFAVSIAIRTWQIGRAHV